MSRLTRSSMRTHLTRAATAVLALTMVGGVGLTAAMHAAAAVTATAHCKTLVFVPEVLGIAPEMLNGTGCDLTYGAHVKPGIVYGQVVGWAKPREFSDTSSFCPRETIKEGICTFHNPH